MLTPKMKLKRNCTSDCPGSRAAFPSKVVPGVAHTMQPRNNPAWCCSACLPRALSFRDRDRGTPLARWARSRPRCARPGARCRSGPGCRARRAPVVGVDRAAHALHDDQVGAHGRVGQRVRHAPQVQARAALAVAAHVQPRLPGAARPALSAAAAPRLPQTREIKSGCCLCHSRAISWWYGTVRGLERRCLAPVLCSASASARAHKTQTNRQT